jgi:hypothetical protein
MAEYQACDSDFKTRDWRTMWNNRIVQQVGWIITEYFKTIDFMKNSHFWLAEGKMEHFVKIL